MTFLREIYRTSSKAALVVALSIAPAQAIGWNTFYQPNSGEKLRGTPEAGLQLVDSEGGGWFGRTLNRVKRFGADMLGHGSILMCEEDPYEGRGIVEVMSITSSYLGESLRNYKLGITAADKALFGRETVTAGLMQDVTTGKRQYGLAAGFNNFKALEESDDVINEFEAQLKERQQEGLDSETLAKLKEANKWLYIANYYQIRTGLGIYYTYSFASNVNNLHDINRVLVNEGVDQTFTAMMRTPQNLLSLAESVGNAAGLYGRLRDVTDFSTEKAALDELGIPGEIRAFEEHAVQQASAANGRYPDLVNFKPSGGILANFMAEQPWAEDGQQALGPAFNEILKGGAMLICELFHGESVSSVSATEVGESAAPSPTLVSLTANEIKTLQSALNQKGYSAGVADGIVGAKTRAALASFRADRGLPGGGEVNRLGLEQLKAN